MSKHAASELTKAVKGAHTASEVADKAFKAALQHDSAGDAEKLSRLVMERVVLGSLLEQVLSAAAVKDNVKEKMQTMLRANRERLHEVQPMMVALKVSMPSVDEATSAAASSPTIAFIFILC